MRALTLLLSVLLVTSTAAHADRIKDQASACTSMTYELSPLLTLRGVLSSDQIASALLQTHSDNQDQALAMATVFGYASNRIDQNNWTQDDMTALTAWCMKTSMESR